MNRHFDQVLSPGGRAALAVAVLLPIAMSAPLRGDDPADALDRELLGALEGASPTERPLQIIPRLIDSTQTAATRLRDGQLGEETQQLQTQILADIDALLEQAAPPARPPQNSPPSSTQQQQQQQPSRSQQQDAAGQDSQSGNDTQSDPNAPSRESQERAASGTQTDAEQDRRLGLSTSAWGHLPPKVREQMRSAFSEEYLPQYDALVRQYYEALARRRASEP